MGYVFVIAIAVVIFLTHHLSEISIILFIVYVSNKRRELIKNKLISFLKKFKLKFIAVNKRFQLLIKSIKEMKNNSVVKL